MIEHRTGDILRTDAEALVNTVNCVGIMGRGVALQFKNAYPANFQAYSDACAMGHVQPGRMFVFDTGYLTNPRYIINFPTKRHWRGKSRLEDIEAGLVDLKRVIDAYQIRSIAIPPLGAGLGGLNWSDVRPLIESSLHGFKDLHVLLFEPGRAPDPKVMARSLEVPTMTSGRAALVGLIHRYLSGLLDPFVTLLEVHKLLYFMQRAGQPLRLQYKKAGFGPYAENLRHVLKAVEGHLVTGYADGGDAPDKQLELVPGAFSDAETALATDSATRERFDRVSALVDGFESPFGLELLATVHWVVMEEGARNLDDVVTATYGWNEWKRKFSKPQIELAYSTLSDKGWLETVQ